MVTELVREKLKPEHAKLARRINAKYSDINSLAAKRNDILHVVYLDEQTFMKTKVFQDVGYLGGKVGNDLIDAIHKTTMDCLDMSIDLMKLNKEVLALKDYKNKSLAKALGEYIARHKSPMDPNAGVFGLLDNPAKT